ncbi:hypothetical protein GOP47_0012457 [Adiantum capillus-veneris]|uniref:Uncharacterized protein n=1 Tax=Adiantum capillus-veneris TaxID=13818 RepID=A0A9D4UQY6_ADICA|nr:hypothetical protein GOP47_0012457 [Adiantum capillus-veneris]
MEQLLDRCHKGVTFLLRSSRDGLESRVDLDAQVIDDVLDLESSTKLKKIWFQYEEVDFTKKKLSEWLHKQLGEVTVG